MKTKVSKNGNWEKVDGIKEVVPFDFVCQAIDSVYRPKSRRGRKLVIEKRKVEDNPVENIYRAYAVAGGIAAKIGKARRKTK